MARLRASRGAGWGGAGVEEAHCGGAVLAVVDAQTYLLPARYTYPLTAAVAACSAVSPVPRKNASTHDGSARIASVTDARFPEAIASKIILQ